MHRSAFARLATLLPALAALALPAAAQTAAPAAPPPAAPANAAPALWGDVNGDGQVTLLDALAVIARVVGKELPAGYSLPVADVDGNGRVTAMDALVIAGYAAGRDMSQYAVGKAVGGTGSGGGAPGGIQRLVCTADVAAPSVSCVPETADAGGADHLIIGGQGTNVLLANTNTSFNAGTGIFSTDVTVKNLIAQPLGTTDGVTLDADKVRVFFFLGPVGIPTGLVDVHNADGAKIYTSGSPQPYFEYPQVLAHNQTSAAKTWQFEVGPGATSFTFKVLVAAAVQFPQGYVDVTPAADTLSAGGTVQLSGVVRTATGTVISGETITWTTSSSAVATVDAAGLVTATGDGVDTVTATAGTRSGHAIIVVRTASAATTTITPAPATVAAGDSALLTVQVKSAGGFAITTGGAAVVLSSTAGTLSPVTDNADGTYTAYLKHTVFGPVLVSGTLNGTDIGDTATVTFTAAGPATLVRLAGDGAAVTAGDPAAIAPSVRVEDVHGNPVSGASVVFSTLTPGGSVTGGTQTSDASGVATVGSWILGAGANTLTVTSGAASTTFTGFGNTLPAGGEDDLTAVGNVTVTATGLLGNDADADGDAFAVTAETKATANGGSATFTAAGGLTYLSAAGFTGTDSVTYTLTDARGGTGTGLVVVSVPDRVWYVQAGASGDGRAATPFGTLAQAEAQSAAGDSILVLNAASALTDSITLQSGQALLGQGIPASIVRTLSGSAHLTVSPVTLLASTGVASTISRTSAGSAVRLGAGTGALVVRGLSITTSNGAGIVGGSFNNATIGGGDLTVSANGGPAIDLADGEIIGLLSSASSAGSATTGIRLSAISGNLGISAGSVTGSAGAAFDFAGGSALFTYDGSASQTNDAPLVSVTGGHTGTLTFQTGTLSATNGNGLQFDNADGAYHFDGTTTLNGGDAGIDVDHGSGGTFAFGAGTSISHPVNEAVTVRSSAPDFTYAGTLLKANNGNGGITVAFNTGGAVRFTGPSVVLSTLSANAVNLLSNSGTAVSFADSLNLTSSGIALNAVGGGTLTVTGAHNDIHAVGGTALNVQGVSIGAAGLTFRSVSASGAASGIVLSNTGSAGGLTVTGDGGTCITVTSACTGGTIQNTSGPGISLSNTASPSFSHVRILATGGSGVGGTGVAGFTFTAGLIDGSGTAHGADGSSIGFGAAGAGTQSNLSGAVVITGNTLTNAWIHGIDIANYSGTITSAGISDNSVVSAAGAASSHGSGIRLLGFGSAGGVSGIVRASISDNTVTGFPSGSGIETRFGNPGGPAGTWGTPGSATDAVSVLRNTVGGSGPAALTGGDGIVATLRGAGQAGWKIDDNGTPTEPVGNVAGAGIRVEVRGAGATATASVTGNSVIAANGPGIALAADSATSLADAPQLTADVSANHVSATGGPGIDVAAGGASAADLRVKVIGNVVAVPLGANVSGIVVAHDGATGGAPSVCLRASGNTGAGSGTASGIALGRTAPFVFAVHAMAVTDSPAVEAYVDALNPAAGGTALTAATTGFSTCTLP
ncbi:MAG TPA: invasin domain 3-containing protein [Longimicrobiaceae bacterium]|jgi:hypothetical protein|nr:invasin domain 3-containing protein [Longimicrobiaceae bacterium]